MNAHKRYSQKPCCIDDLMMVKRGKPAVHFSDSFFHHTLCHIDGNAVRFEHFNLEIHDFVEGCKRASLRMMGNNQIYPFSFLVEPVSKQKFTYADINADKHLINNC